MSVRKLRLEDSKRLRKLFLIENTLKDTGISVTQDKITNDFVNNWLKENLKQYSLKKPEFIVYSVCNYFNQLIGTVGLGNINYKKHSGEIGYWISLKNTGKGHCTNAIKIFLKNFPKLLKINKIFAEVSEKNPASGKVLEKNEFKLIKKSKGYLFFEKKIY